MIRGDGEMVPEEVLEWRLSTPQGPDVDIVGSALGCAAAAVRYGPHRFDFAKTRLPDGDLLLTLTPTMGDTDAPPGRAHILGDCVAEVRVPVLVGDQRPDARKRSEALLVQSLGRGLFRDVAHMVDGCTSPA
jgi:hypothetical protein